jgi:hypothetical protein
MKKGLGSISQRYESGDLDPDPHQNLTDPQQWLEFLLSGISSPPVSSMWDARTTRNSIRSSSSPQKVSQPRVSPSYLSRDGSHRDNFGENL